MPKSNFEQQRDFYNKILSEDYSKSKVSREYKKVLGALRELAVCTDGIQSENNPDGLMTPVTYRQVCDAYENVMVACGEFLTKNVKHSNFENSRMNIVKELGSVAAKDLKVLNGLDKDHPGTLKNAIRESRTSKLHFSGENLKKIGGAQSSRIPIKKGNGQKGYFTKAHTYNLDKVWTESVAKHMNGIPKKYREVFEKLKTDVNLQAGFVRSLPSKIDDKAFTKESISFIFANSLSNIGIGSYDEAMEILGSNEKMGQAVLGIAGDLIDHKVTIGMMEAAGIKKDSRTDMRNCAMSDMARLLGCSDLLAEAKPMEIYIDGEVVEGAFMENVEGIDINHLPKDFDVKSTNKDNFFNQHALSQLADLQVLDFICGNVDRHDANIIYNFEKLPDGTQRVKSIKGIDNDCSFGTLKLDKSDTEYLKMAGPSGIGYITEEMAEKLENIDINSMKLMLANDELSGEEIEAASERLNQIKEMIAEKKIQIMKKEDWGNVTLDQMAKKGKYFSRMNSMANNFSLKQPAIDSQKEFADSNEINSTNLLLENYSRLEGLKESMDNASVKLHKNSSEFNKMKERLNNVLELAKQYKVNYLEQNQELPEADAQKFLNAMKELNDHTNTYILAKGITPSTGYGKQRLQMAKDIRDFVNEYMSNSEIGKEAEPMEMKQEEMQL